MSQDSPYESTFGASLLEHEDAAPQNPTDNATMGELISQRFSRRGLLKGALAVSAISATVGTLALETAERAQAQAAKSAFAFKEVEAGVDADHHVAEGYDAQVLLRWGDPITPGAPPSTRRSRRRRLRPSNLATTTTSSAICRCPARRTRPPMACSSSITNTPTRI